jgi:hypothetical protein
MSDSDCRDMVSNAGSPPATRLTLARKALLRLAANYAQRGDIPTGELNTGRLRARLR